MGQGVGKEIAFHFRAAQGVGGGGIARSVTYVTSQILFDFCEDSFSFNAWFKNTEENAEQDLTDRSGLLLRNRGG